MITAKRAEQLIRSCSIGHADLDDIRDPQVIPYINDVWYLTTDGEVFSTKAAAINWQIKLLEEGNLGD